MDAQQIIGLRLPFELHSIILVCGMFRPCIVLQWLGKVVQEFLNEHLHDVCINLIILEVDFNYCPHFNLQWLGKVVEEFHNEHLNDVCINLIILEVVFNYCPHFNNNFELWLDFGKLSLI